VRIEAWGRADFQLIAAGSKRRIFAVRGVVTYDIIRSDSVSISSHCVMMIDRAWSSQQTRIEQGERKAGSKCYTPRTSLTTPDDTSRVRLCLESAARPALFSFQTWRVSDMHHITLRTARFVPSIARFSRRSGGLHRPGPCQSALAANECKVVDTAYLIDQDADLAIGDRQGSDGLEVISPFTRHTCWRMRSSSCFPDAQVTIGPVIENGFLL